MEARYKYTLTQPMRELFICALHHVDTSQVGYYDFQDMFERLKEPEISLTDNETSVLLKASDTYIDYAEAWSDDWLRLKEHMEARKAFIELTRKKLSLV